MDNAKNKSSRVSRWRLSLAEFDKDIVYKKGTENVNADALSRIEIETDENQKTVIINCILTEHISQFGNIIAEQKKDKKLQHIKINLEKGKYHRFIEEDIVFIN
jgi:hypothetical protein